MISVRLRTVKIHVNETDCSSPFGIFLVTPTIAVVVHYDEMHYDQIGR